MGDFGQIVKNYIFQRILVKIKERYMENERKSKRKRKIINKKNHETLQFTFMSFAA